MPLPPFELLYRHHRDELYGYMRAQLPGEEAADAFQETLLRALRTYDGLEHGRELRGWLYTIARSVLADRSRRLACRPTEVAAAADDVAPAAATSDPTSRVVEDEGLAQLTSELPSTERAAVVLRYGFDLDYDDIGAALDSSSDAARQAASSGVRRLRKQLCGEFGSPDTPSADRKRG